MRASVLCIWKIDLPTLQINETAIQGYQKLDEQILERPRSIGEQVCDCREVSSRHCDVSAVLVECGDRQQSAFQESTQWSR